MAIPDVPRRMSSRRFASDYEAHRPPQGRGGWGFGRGRFMVRTATRRIGARIPGRSTLRISTHREATTPLPDRAQKYAACVDASFSVRNFLSCREFTYRCRGGYAWKPTSVSLAGSQIRTVKSFRKRNVRSPMRALPAGRARPYRRARSHGIPGFRCALSGLHLRSPYAGRRPKSGGPPEAQHSVMVGG